MSQTGYHKKLAYFNLRNIIGLKSKISNENSKLESRFQGKKKDFKYDGVNKGANNFK